MDENIVYSKEVIEFTAVANEYCRFLEEASSTDGKNLLAVLQKLLPLLYMKSLYLPDIETKIDEDIEKFVREEDWQAIKNTLTFKIGAANDYLDVNPDKESTEELIYSDIAENLADIYQDIKDFLMVYRIGTVELMNDALRECKESFRIYWGQKLVNTIRSIHFALIDPEKIGEDTSISQNKTDKSDWIITRRQDEFRKENDDDI
ncbi:MAG TPA: DUF5063 domain-containing protein [Bacteroidales bacterium]|nr:DUF5063 domain-containing protein [Bacteroidales bacterium]